MNIQYENKILNHFIPVLYLHKNELISPISIKKYIDNCELCINGEKKKIQMNYGMKKVKLKSIILLVKIF